MDAIVVTCAIERAPAMIEIVRHLRLVKGKHPLPVTTENVPPQTPTAGLQHLAGSEHPSIVGDVEEVLEMNSPRVAVRLRFVPQHRHAPVDIGGEASIPAIAEYRQVSGIRVDEREIGRAER